MLKLWHRRCETCTAAYWLDLAVKKIETWRREREKKVKGKKKRSIKGMKESSLSQRAIVSPMWHNKEPKVLHCHQGNKQPSLMQGADSVCMTEIYSTKKFPVVKTSPLCYAFCVDFWCKVTGCSLFWFRVHLRYSCKPCMSAHCKDNSDDLVHWHSMYYFSDFLFSLHWMSLFNTQIIKFIISVQSSFAGFNELCEYTEGMVSQRSWPKQTRFMMQITFFHATCKE